MFNKKRTVSALQSYNTNREPQKNMPAVIGNRELCDRFCRNIRLGTLAHAYIIEGPFGTGKYTFALNVAAAISCEHGGESDAVLPCGACNACRKILGEITPDVSVICCKDGKSSISKEQIREMREKICFSPNEMKKRVIIIKNAELMTAEAQNALLLTLEEPPEYVVFILLTENSRGLLETVRSRAPIFRIKRLDDGTVRKYLTENIKSAAELESRDPRALSEIIVSASGSIGLAAKLLDPAQKEELTELRSLSDEFIEALRAVDGIARLLSMFESPFFKSRDNTGKLLSSVITAQRDLLLLRRADDVRLCYYTDQDSASELAMSFSVANLIRYIELCEEARIAVTVKNTNIKLTLLKLVNDIF